MRINLKTLIVGRGVWDDSLGDTGHYSNIFHGADFEKTAYIYIESSKPTSSLCRYFFQISEINLLKKIYKWNIETGNEIDLGNINTTYIANRVVSQEKAAMNFVRKHRHPIFTWAREILWSLGGWKTKKLEDFISTFHPDKVFFFGSPLLLMNKLASFVIDKAKVPAAIYLMDDAYTYVNTDKGIIHLLYRYLLRKSIKEVVSKCQKVYVISPKMKEEYDKAFGIDSVFLTKSIDFSKTTFTPIQKRKPIKMVYMGQVIYGRISSLLAIAKALDIINKDEIFAELDIYTINKLTEEQLDSIENSKGVYLQEPIHASKVPETISKYDVVVFVESFEEAYRNSVRLSFSTKITDYLGSGKCIFAIGPSDIAPIDYLKNEDAAIVATSVDDISKQINLLMRDDIIQEYSEKAFRCGQKNHSRERIDNELYNNFLNQKAQ